MSRLWPLISGCRCPLGAARKKSRQLANQRLGTKGKFHRQLAPPPTTNISKEAIQ